MSAYIRPTVQKCIWCQNSARSDSG